MDIFDTYNRRQISVLPKRFAKPNLSRALLRIWIQDLDYSLLGISMNRMHQSRVDSVHGTHWEYMSLYSTGASKITCHAC